VPYLPSKTTEVLHKSSQLFGRQFLVGRVNISQVERLRFQGLLDFGTMGMLTTNLPGVSVSMTRDQMYPNVSVSVVLCRRADGGTGRPADFRQTKQNCTIFFPKKGETEQMSMHPFSLLHTIPHTLFFSMQLPLHAWKRQGSMILMRTVGSSCTNKLMMLSDPNVQIAQCCSTKAATDCPSKLKING